MSQNKPKNQQTGGKNKDQKNRGKKDKGKVEEQQEKRADENLLNKFKQLQEELTTAQEKEKRALADYQNLLRRTEQERGRIARFANRQLIEKLLPVVDGLDKAAEQLQDSGLDIVANQLWSVLKEAGLEKIKPLGKEFDVETMEAVSRQGDENQVVDVAQEGYRLKGEVIQHAKVVLGNLEKDSD